MSRARGTVALLLAWAALGSCDRGDEPRASGVSPEHGGHGSAAPAPPHPEERGPGELPSGMAEVEVPYERRQLIGVRTAELALRPLAREIRTVGLVVEDERRVRRIQTKTTGWVEELFVNFTGEPVRAGQPILSIYSPELVASQSEYLLALEAFGADGEAPGLDPRERRLLVDSARRRLERYDVAPSHIAELERTRDAKRRIVLHSPIAGYVTLKSVLQGMYVTREMELYTVTDLDRVWIWADVNEDEIPLVELGQRARIEVASAPGERTATVSFLQPTLDPATRTLRVRFDAENPEGTLKPGMYATVGLERPLGEVLALPEDAVIDTGTRRLVFVEVAEGRFQPREVELGRKGQGHYEVLRGLSAGERVVVSSQFLLDSESRLRGVARPGHGSH